MYLGYKTCISICERAKNTIGRPTYFQTVKNCIYPFALEIRLRKQLLFVAMLKILLRTNVLSIKLKLYSLQQKHCPTSLDEKGMVFFDGQIF